MELLWLHWLVLGLVLVVAEMASAGGFYITLKLDGIEEEPAAQAILSTQHLLVHPGYFYDIEPDHLVLSFIQEPDVIRNSLPRLLAALDLGVR